MIRERAVRAGLNTKRARRARGVLALNAGRTRLDDAEVRDALVDVLANLLHLCQRQAVDFDAALDTARRHFHTEAPGPPSLAEGDYFARSAGLATMDEVAAAIAERTGWEIFKVRQEIDRADPQRLWDAHLGPMLDRIEEEIRLAVFDGGDPGEPAGAIPPRPEPHVGDTDGNEAQTPCLWREVANPAPGPGTQAPAR